MKKLIPIFLFLLLLVYQSSTAQQSKGNASDVHDESNFKKPDDADVYTYEDVDTKPVLIEGMESLYKKWNAAATYPVKARKNGIEGKVILSVIINEKGEMTQPKVEHGLGYGCDEAAIEALQQTKSLWTPAIKNGQPVKVWILLPFAFTLK